MEGDLEVKNFEYDERETSLKIMVATLHGVRLAVEQTTQGTILQQKETTESTSSTPSS